MAILNATKLSCSLCRHESTVGEIGDHLAQVHIGAGESDWLCANGCHYRVRSQCLQCLPSVSCVVIIDVEQGGNGVPLPHHKPRRLRDHEAFDFRRVALRTTAQIHDALSDGQEQTSSTQSNECSDVLGVGNAASAPQSFSGLIELAEEQCIDLSEPREHSQRTLSADAETALGNLLDQSHIKHQKAVDIGVDVDSSESEEEPSESETEIESPMSPVQERINQTNDDKARATYDCQHCNYSSSKRRLLLDHVRKCHAREKRYRCPHCSYASVRSYNLKEHVRTHTGERPFKCSQCPYRAAVKACLNTHLRTQTGERPFQCMLCTYAATNSSDLDRHKRKHTGERSFKCFRCPYQTARRTSLNNHLRMHTGVRAFKCTLCPYSAAQKPRLTKHRRTHPNIPLHIAHPPPHF